MRTSDDGVADLYRLDQYRNEIVALDGFGEKSYEKLQASINESRNTTFARFVAAMDIPMIGRTASRELEKHFNGSLRSFELAAMERYDFTCLPDFGKTMRDNIHEWFHDSDNIILWRTLQKELHFEERKEENTMSMRKNRHSQKEGKSSGVVVSDQHIKSPSKLKSGFGGQSPFRSGVTT